VCHTDLHYREGGINDDFPFLLGHEAAGVVESVGPDVTGLEPGITRVTLTDGDKAVETYDVIVQFDVEYLRTLEMLGFPAAQTSLVLNRVTPKVGLTKQDVEVVLGLEVRFEIPNDSVVAPAVNSGAVAAIVESESEFSQAVTLIAQSFERAGDTVASRAAQAPKRRWLTSRRVLEGRAT